MTARVFVKRYDDGRRQAAARRHLAWLHRLDSDVVLPGVIDATAGNLVLEHLGDRRPGPEHLCEIADALGRLHAAAYRQGLHAARLDRPFTTAGIVIADFVGPRRRVLRLIPVPVDDLPAALYKDANIRNFVLVDDSVAMVDFDTLTLAPFGYDLAKLVVSTVMTYGPIAETSITAALRTYNRRVAPLHRAAPCSQAQFDAYADIHHLLTAPYLGRNGYRYTWAAQQTIQRSGRSPEPDLTSSDARRPPISDLEIRP